MTSKFNIGTDFASYSARVGSDVVMEVLDGPAGRYRQDVKRATSRIAARWTLTQFQFRYARAFYNTATALGSLPFHIDLTIDNSSVEQVTAHFIPGSFQWQFESGVHVVTAELEVERNPAN